MGSGTQERSRQTALLAIAQPVTAPSPATCAPRRPAPVTAGSPSTDCTPDSRCPACAPLILDSNCQDRCPDTYTEVSLASGRFNTINTSAVRASQRNHCERGHRYRTYQHDSTALQRPERAVAYALKENAFITSQIQPTLF